MFIIQALDHEDGTAAKWFDLLSSKHETREATREHLKRIRATDSEDSTYSYRVVEVGSEEYYKQPTDVLEW